MPVGAFSFSWSAAALLPLFFVVAGLAKRFASDPFVSYIS